MASRGHTRPMDLTFHTPAVGISPFSQPNFSFPWDTYSHLSHSTLQIHIVQYSRSNVAFSLPWTLESLGDFEAPLLKDNPDGSWKSEKFERKKHLKVFQSSTMNYPLEYCWFWALFTWCCFVQVKGLAAIQDHLFVEVLERQGEENWFKSPRKSF